MDARRRSDRTGPREARLVVVGKQEKLENAQLPRQDSAGISTHTHTHVRAYAYKSRIRTHTYVHLFYIDIYRDTARRMYACDILASPGGGGGRGVPVPRRGTFRGRSISRTLFPATSAEFAAVR